MNHVAKTKGFTLIELMLAMTFISILLLAIAMTIIQISQTYNRGVTLGEVNQASRAISDRINREIAASPSFSVNPDSHSYVPTEWGGRLCLGQYSYIWNYAPALQVKGDANAIHYNNDTDTKIRFIRVPDAGAAYCSGGEGYVNINPVGAVELLNVGDHDLMLYKFAIHSQPTAIDPATGTQLYTVDFTIGTGKKSAMNADFTACLPPNDPASDFAYCAIQDFSLVVRAGNGVN